jgi:hypothetical protein
MTAAPSWLGVSISTQRRMPARFFSPSKVGMLEPGVWIIAFFTSPQREVDTAGGRMCKPERGHITQNQGH